MSLLHRSEDATYLDGQVVGTLTRKANNNWLPEAVVGNGFVNPGWPATPSSSDEETPFPFNGQIDEFALYDTPLSASQVAAHHAAARNPVPYKLTKITLPSGRVWAENVYDSATERIKTHTDQHGGTWQVDVPVYNPETGMSVVTVTDPHNGKLLYEHDALRGYRRSRPRCGVKENERRLPC